MEAVRMPNLPDLPVLEIDPNPQPMDPDTPVQNVTDDDSIKQFGRTFHHYKPGSYLLPNDDHEQDRLNLQHYVQFLLLDEKLHKAPLELQSLRCALDMGTGTGIWAIEFAQTYPDCRVIGSDLSLIQPSEAAPNCDFVRDDVQDEWSFTSPFDYIHGRLVCGHVKDVQDIVRQAFRHLRPGGWLELQEFTHQMYSPDDTLKGTTLETMNKAFIEAFMQGGRNPWVMMQLKQILGDVGFVDVEEEIQPLPMGSWPKHPKYKRVGRWHGVNMFRAFDAVMKPMVISGLSEDQAQDYMAEAQAELRSGHHHVHQLYYVVYGRKPPG